MEKSDRRGVLAVIAAGAVGLFRFGEDIAKIAPDLFRGLRGLNNANIAENINCTDAYIDSFQWKNTEYLKERFVANVVNTSDTGGSIEIVLRFYYTSEANQVIGEVYERRTIRGGTFKLIKIETIPPEESEYASMTVLEQDCS